LWRQAAERVDGRYEPIKGKKTGKILVQDGPWSVELASHVVNTGNAVVTVTRCRVLARGVGDFRFRIHRRGVLGGLASLLGLGGIPLNDPRLKRRIVARSRDKDRVRTLARDPAISGPVFVHYLRLKFGKAPRKDRRLHGPDTRAITVEVDTLVLDVDRLVAMIDLTRTTLARLATVGAIDPTRAPT
jgi:hypothetical protein